MMIVMTSLENVVSRLAIVDYVFSWGQDNRIYKSYTNLDNLIKLAVISSGLEVEEIIVLIFMPRLAHGLLYWFIQIEYIGIVFRL